MLGQTVKELKWRFKHVRFEKFLDQSLLTEYRLADCSRQQGRHDWTSVTEGSLTVGPLGFQRWIPVREVTGRPEARPRRRCCSEFNHLGHLGDFIGSQCKRTRTGVIYIYIYMLYIYISMKNITMMSYKAVRETSGVAALYRHRQSPTVLRSLYSKSQTVGYTRPIEMSFYPELALYVPLLLLSTVTCSFHI